MFSANIRLINGTNQCSGRLEVYQGVHWLPVYKVDFGMNEVAVVCREMNCGDPVKVTGSFGNSGELRGIKVRCSGGENSVTRCTLTDYVKTSTDRIQDASIECSGRNLHIFSKF